MKENAGLTILIPTRNRATRLKENLNNIATILNELEEEGYVYVIVSDNASQQEELSDIEASILQYPYEIKLNKNTTNCGIEENILRLIDMCETKYCMLLGDDDFFSAEYLSQVLNYVRKDEVFAIFPNCFSVDKDRRKISEPRDKEAGDRLYAPGENLDLILRAHQMSGLVFRPKGLVELYRKNVAPNVYPMMYFMGYNLIHGPSVHITNSPLEITMISKKNFDYSFDNLMGDLSRSVDSIPISDKKMRKQFIYSFAYYNRGRFVNRSTLLHPKKTLQMINSQYGVSGEMQRALLTRFAAGFATAPVRLLKKLSSTLKAKRE